MRWHLSAFIQMALSAALLPLHAWAAEPSPAVRAAQVADPARVLFVGNSYFYYNDSLHNHVRRLRAGGDGALESRLPYKSATIGGASLDHHRIDWLTQPGAIGVREPFELVILQGGSAEPLSPSRRETFRKTAIEFDRIIRERGGRTALYMPHVYAAPHRQARPENLRMTVDTYLSVGNEIGALVIPVGLAFEEAYKRRPGLALHKPDGTHPSMLGTYLAACTVYASIYGRSPVGNGYTYGGAVDAAEARFLQEVAHDTVRAFYAR